MELQNPATIFIGFDFFYRQQQCVAVICITNGPALWEIITIKIAQNCVEVFPRKKEEVK